MNLSTTILGSTAVKQLQATSRAWVLEVGSDRLTRAELARVGCYNFLAAKNLTTILKGLTIKNLADLYARIPPAAVAVPHMGAISLAVLGAAFEAKRIGGEMPLENWVRKHATTNGHDAAAAMVSFHTIKRRELAEIAAERKARKHRKRERRHIAHATRVARFTDRSAQPSAANPG
jgi:hypothetical protein